MRLLPQLDAIQPLLEPGPADDSSPSSSTEPEVLGPLLRRFRLRAGMSQTHLAERAGLSTTAIAALERGKRRAPHPHTFAMLAEALGLGPTDREAFLRAAVRAPAAPRRSRPSRLPVPPTLLVGREDEVALAAGLLQPRSGAARLLTLTGPGGVGKTRLALAVAAALRDAYRDGVIFVDLAPVPDPRLVPAALARGLELRESGGRSARELLIAHLRERQLLLVLDNFEHVLPAAVLLAELLTDCSELQLLVTSRTVLRLRAEQQFPVGPLPVPAPRESSAAAISQSAAVRLFVQRARAVDPAFSLSALNAAAVAGVCRRLDGMPLAIELAAARVGWLAPEALLSRLQARLALLDSGAPDLPPRQQTLRATLAWSHRLLGTEEQVLFRRLAVFVGGWTLEAAEAVCADGLLPGPEVAGRLGGLVDNSLARRQDRGGSTARFSMLETIREYALERLAEDREINATRTRALAYFLSLTEAAAPQLQGPEQVSWLNRLEAENDNLRAVLGWTTDVPGSAAQLRLATNLRYFWYVRGYHQEGRDRLTALLGVPAAADPTLDRARALNALGFLNTMQGQEASAGPLFEEALALGRSFGDLATQAFSLRYLGALANAAGNHMAARAALEESVAHFGAIGAEAERALALMYLGDVASALDDDGWAEQLYTGCLDLQRALNNTNAMGYPLRRLGYLALRRGDFVRAVRLCLESLRLNTEVGDRQGMAASLVGLAESASRQREPLRAARLLGAADALVATADTQLLALDRQQRAQLLAHLATEVSTASLAAARIEGSRMSAEQVGGLSSLAQTGDSAQAAPVLAKQGDSALAAGRGRERVWRYLVAHAGGDGSVEAAIADLAHQTQLSDRQVQRTLRTLEREGCVRIEQRPGRGRNPSMAGNRYWLRLRDIEQR